MFQTTNQLVLYDPPLLPVSFEKHPGRFRRSTAMIFPMTSSVYKQEISPLWVIFHQYPMIISPHIYNYIYTHTCIYSKYSHPQIDGQINHHQISSDLLFHLLRDSPYIYIYNYIYIYHHQIYRINR